MARHYTVEEASETLAFVAPILYEAVRLKREYDDLRSRTGEGGLESGLDPQRKPAELSLRSKGDEERIAEIREQLPQHLELITRLGIQVKDLNTGLIDFPTMRDGEEVLLCWRLGEPAIAYWHTYEEGYLGRRPI